MKNIKKQRLNPNEIYIQTIITPNEATKYIVLWRGLKNINKLVTVMGLKICGIAPTLEDNKRYSDQKADPRIPGEELDNILKKSGCKKTEIQTLSDYLSTMPKDKMNSLLELLEKVRNESYLHCQTGIDILTLIACELNDIEIGELPSRQANQIAGERTGKLALETVEILISYDENGDNVQYRVAREALTKKENRYHYDRIVPTEKCIDITYEITCNKKGIVVDKAPITDYLTETEKQLYEYALSQGHYQVCLDILQIVEERLNKEVTSIKLTPDEQTRVRKRIKDSQKKYPR